MDKFEKVMEILSQERDKWENLRTEALSGNNQDKSSWYYSKWRLINELIEKINKTLVL
jgi:hypothetical protein